MRVVHRRADPDLEPGQASGVGPAAVVDVQEPAALLLAVGHPRPADVGLEEHLRRGHRLDRGERAIPVLPPQPEQQVEAGSGGVDPPRVTQSVGDQLQPAGQLLRRRVVLDQVALQQRRERDPHRQAPRAFAGPGSVRCRAALLERRPSRSGCGRAGVPVVLQARAAAVLAGDDQRVERLQSPGPLAGLRVGPAGSSDMSTRGPAGMLTCGSSEPAVGFEPTAYRLQAAREPSSGAASCSLYLTVSPGALTDPTSVHQCRPVR